MVLFALGLTLYLGMYFTLWLHQEQFIFKPSPHKTQSLRISGYRRIPLSIPFKNGHAQAHIFTPSLDPKISERLIIYFYGNAENLESSLPKIQWISKRTRAAIFCAEYPGYGSTAGDPSQKSILDLMGLWNNTLQEEYSFSANNTIVWGFSLGGAVAAQHHKKHGTAGIILENTFNSLIDLASERYPLMPISLICRHPFRSDQALSQASVPILVMHCKQDGVVPFHLGKRLASELKHSTFIETKGKHSDSHKQSQIDITRTLKKIFPEHFTDIVY